MAFMSGATHVLQWPIQTVARPQGGANRRKSVSVRIVRLQLACLKLESLVIADQHAAVNTFPGLVHTARHITKAGCTRSRHTNPQGREAPKVWSVIGVKS